MPQPEEKNNFERLMEELEAQVDEDKQNEIYSGVWGTLDTFKMVGVMVDMYVPKLFQFLIELSSKGGGGNGDSDPE